MKLIKTSSRGITYSENKKGVTYYYSYRDTETKKVKRKKLFSKDKHMSKYVKECIVKIEEIKEEKIQSFYTSANIEDSDFQNYLTLNELADLYFEYRLKKKERTLREYYSYFSDLEFRENKTVQRKIYNTKKDLLSYNKHVRNYEIAQINVNKITRKDINYYIENDMTKNITEKTKRDIITSIKTIINHNIRHEIINIDNPFQNIQFKDSKRRRERALSTEEMTLLLKEAKKYNHDQEKTYMKKGSDRNIPFIFKKNYNIYLSIYLGIMTAGRKDSILNIRKKDIDLKGQTVSLINQKNRMKPYKVSLTSECCDWLEKKVLPYYEYDEFLIRPMDSSRRSGQAMKDVPEEVFKLMDTLFNEGLNKQDPNDRLKVVNFHTLRRSVATNLVKNGTDIANVMILLNHSSINQTEEYLNLNHNQINNDIADFMKNIFKKIND